MVSWFGSHVFVLVLESFLIEWINWVARTGDSPGIVGQGIGEVGVVGGSAGAQRRWRRRGGGGGDGGGGGGVDAPVVGVAQAVDGVAAPLAADAAVHHRNGQTPTLQADADAGPAVAHHRQKFALKRRK